MTACGLVFYWLCFCFTLVCGVFMICFVFCDEWLLYIVICFDCCNLLIVYLYWFVFTCVFVLVVDWFAFCFLLAFDVVAFSLFCLWLSATWFCCLKFGFKFVFVLFGVLVCVGCLGVCLCFDSCFGFYLICWFLLAGGSAFWLLE